MQAGVAKVVITPPVPVQLCGYGIERVSSEIADELFARALVVEHDGRRVALVSCELLWVERRHLRVIRRLVHELTGIAPDDVMVSAVHNHNGPDTLDWYHFAPVDQAWLSSLLRQIAGAVWLANARLRPVKAELTRGELAIGINRRQFNQDDHGTTVTLGERPDGPVDRSLTALRLVDEAGALYAAVLCHGTHPVSLGSAERVISSDWPGRMCAMVEQSLGGTCLFVNGPAGDVNPIMFGIRGWDTMVRVGKQAGGGAIEVLNHFDAEAGVGVGAVRREITVPHKDHPYLDIPLARRLGEDGGLVVEVQALRLGPLKLISQPGECLTETAWRIQERTQLKGAVVAGYTNDYVGYLPLPHIYDEGGYEPGSTMLPAESVLRLMELSVEVADALAAAG